MFFSCDWWWWNYKPKCFSQKWVKGMVSNRVKLPKCRLPPLTHPWLLPLSWSNHKPVKKSKLTENTLPTEKSSSPCNICQFRSLSSVPGGWTSSGGSDSMRRGGMGMGSSVHLGSSCCLSLHGSSDWKLSLLAFHFPCAKSHVTFR